jgi:hypothetical protein
VARQCFASVSRAYDQVTKTHSHTVNDEGPSRRGVKEAGLKAEKPSQARSVAKIKQCGRDDVITLPLLDAKLSRWSC